MDFAVFMVVNKSIRATVCEVESERNGTARENKKKKTRV